MALDPSKLKFFTQAYPTNPYEAAKNIASVYASYAADATTLVGAAPPTFTEAEQQVLTAILAQALSVPAPTPAVFAQALALGLTAFWLTPPVVFTGGVVTAAVFAPLAGILTAALSTNVTDIDQVNKVIGAIVHAHTISVVIVLIVGVPPVPSILI